MTQTKLILLLVVALLAALPQLPESPCADLILLLHNGVTLDCE
jgi:hypothetical protein